MISICKNGHPLFCNITKALTCFQSRHQLFYGQVEEDRAEWTALLDTSSTLHHSSVELPDLHPHGQVRVDVSYHVQHASSQFQLLHGPQQMVSGY